MHMKLYVEYARPFSYVPRKILFALLFGLIIQISWHGFFSGLDVKRKALPDTPSPEIIQFIGLNDTITLAKLMMLWLQAFDTQPGVSIPLRELDYHKVADWLDLILSFDKKSEYPLLAAARIYAEVPAPEKQRVMTEFIKEKFLELPNRRWPAMAHAVYIAKHRIKDLNLAAEYAKLIRLHATADKVPYWAKQMEFFVLEDMGELEAARILIGGLLESGELKDMQQRRFLSMRLKEIEERQLQEQKY